MSPFDPVGGESPSARTDRTELITATGWRVIGPATEFVSDPMGVSFSAALGPDDILYSAHFTVRPKSARTGAVDVVLSVLDGALSPVRDGGEDLGRDNTVVESSGRFHGVRWDTFAFRDRWAGELTWIHPHPVIAGLPCTTRVALTHHRDRTDLTMHVGTDRGVPAVRGYVGTGQARPPFLPDLHRVARLVFNGAVPDLQTLDASSIDAFVERILMSEKRIHPVAVLAPLEASDPLDPAEYLVPPEELAGELLGLAHLWVIDRHSTTFRLSDAVRDKRLSCFWGALRIYMPGFSRADSGLDHPLLIHDRVADPVERAGLLGELAHRVRDGVPLAFPVDTLREAAERPSPAEASEETPTTVPEPVSAESRKPPAPAVATSPPTASGMEPLLASVANLAGAMAERLDTIAGLQTKLIDEVSRLRTATVVRSANAAGIERRLGQFERTLREFTRQAEPVEAGPGDFIEADDELVEEESEFTLLSVLRSAASEYTDNLLVLDSAFSSADESPFEDILRVATNLKAMAELAGRRQEGRLGMSLRDAFGEAGVEYRGGISRSSSKRQRQQYEATLPDGQTVDCHEHIVLGASYDPRYCLRIYFTSRAPGEPRFVIAHVGRHFEVKTTT